MNLNRSPQGKWISRGEALHWWLPTMMNCMYGKPIQVVLERMADWCNMQASEDLKHASASLGGDTAGNERYAANLMERAQGHMKRRDRLREIAKEFA